LPIAACLSEHAPLSAAAGRWLPFVALIFCCLVAVGQLSFDYAIKSGTVTITRYRCSSGTEVIIPEKIEGLPVTRIGDEALAQCNRLTSVTIPSGVTIIGGTYLRIVYCARPSARNSRNQDTLATLRPYCFAIGGWVSQHACHRGLKLCLPRPKRLLMDSIFRQIDTLDSPFTSSTA
jgi:hypothetical protein